MTKKKKSLVPLFVKVTPEVRALLDEIHERDGLPIRAQLERAIRLFAEKQRQVAA
jgi:hypothetical protein